VCDTKEFERFVNVFTVDATMDYTNVPDREAQLAFLAKWPAE